METLLGWLSRGILLALGVGAALWLARWMRSALAEKHERWAVRVALAMLLLAGVYAVGHARLLLERERIEEGRQRYLAYGDPRLAELRRAEVRGWIQDCTAEEDNALARYAMRDGEVGRVYPLGQAGANLIGGGEDADGRDFTVERLFADWLRTPRSWRERGRLHPAGRDLRLTLCAEPTRLAWRLLREADRPGAVIVQDVATGALVAYAATGGPEQAPYGIKRYAPPGSVFKLALAAAWWERGMPDDEPIPCPPEIRVSPRAVISNSGGAGYGTVQGPAGMLVPSCNTAAVAMALRLREEAGAGVLVDAYRRFGFLPYEEEPPADSLSPFWNTESDRWSRRMTPPPSRIRIGEGTGVDEWAQLAIGQGPVDVTPIAISRFVQAIGNDGVMLPPAIEWDATENTPKGARVMSSETAEKLQAAMREVVERGTARSVAPRLAGLDDWALGGKTGTAQVRGAPDDGWFAGLIFGPGGEPRYTVVVYLRGGGPGGARPARIAAELTRFFAGWEAEPFRALALRPHSGGVS